MSLAFTASQSNLNFSRIKRKPPPVLDISERYPSPDPNDPFAPLWVLRSRTSSALLQSDSQEDLQIPQLGHRRSSYNLYPSPPISPPHSEESRLYQGYVSDNDVPTPLKAQHPSSPKSPHECHYRRRSHSVAAIPSPSASRAAPSPYGYHNLQSHLLADPIPTNTSPVSTIGVSSSILPPPSLIRDNSTSDSSASDIAIDPFPDRDGVASPYPSATSRSKLAQIFLPKKASNISLSLKPSRPRTASPTCGRIRKISISSPLSVITPPMARTGKPQPLTHHRRSTVNTTSTLSNLVAFEPRPPSSDTSSTSTHEHETGYHSQPEIFPSMSSHTTLRDRRASMLPTFTPPSSNSHGSSSYVRVSTPSPSPSFTHSNSNSDYSFPRPAPTPPGSRIHDPIPSSASAPTTHTHSHPTTTQPEWALPSSSQLSRASSLTIIAENGLRVPFGSLFANQRTIVCFIRHFWCPLCQDYMSALTRTVDPHVLAVAGMKLVVISNGAHGMIAKYRQIFGSPFEMYTDPALTVYAALGMGMMARDEQKLSGTGARTRQRMADTDTEGEGKERRMVKSASGYVKHGLMGGIAMVVVRALKVGMPVWEKGGEIGQLGGEFVLGPGPVCTYAHRMQTARGHVPMVDVLKATGISLPGPESTIPARESSRASSKSGHVPSGRASVDVMSGSNRDKSMVRVHGKSTSVGTVSWRETRQSFSPMSVEEQRKWMESRRMSFDKLKEKKSYRRGVFEFGTGSVDAGACESGGRKKGCEAIIGSLSVGVVNAYEEDEGEGGEELPERQRDEEDNDTTQAKEDFDEENTNDDDRVVMFDEERRKARESMTASSDQGQVHKTENYASTLSRGASPSTTGHD